MQAQWNIKWWGPNHLDGGIEWAVFTLPESMRSDVRMTWQGQPDNGWLPPDLLGKAPAIADWLEEQGVNLSYDRRAGVAGQRFQRLPFVQVIGRRCLVTVNFGHDI